MKADRPTKKQIELFISKALRGTISQEEKAILDQWYHEQEEQEAVVYTTLSKEQFREELFKKTLKNIPSPAAKKKTVTRTYISVAASILLLLGGLGFFYQYQTPTGTAAQSGKALFDVYSNGPGLRKKLVLPDGSVAYLNSNSQLTVFQDFSQERKVKLQGEAFFEVKKNEHLPFVVETEGLRTKVLGTSFNVSSYKSASEIVSVRTGKVQVEDKKRESAVFLLPNEQGMLRDGELSRTGVTHPESVFGWVEGKLVFNKTPLREIAPKLEAWYGVKVSVQVESGAPCQLTGTYTNLSLEELMELIKFSINIDYKVEGKKLVIEAKGC
ncbi:FecR family protein [Sabulibacter ruber]|uniref:FecR family protein n=1 Tax=Sabulibacter ruber TaxID=2811901 RepID=UPI001A959224|nr:FecR family protein [Sabulibacter ruber]